MSTIRLSGTSSGYYDLTVPAAAGTNSIDLSNLPVKDSSGNLGLGATPSAKLHVYKQSAVTAQIGSSTNGHYFESQSDSGSNGFEIYQLHGTNTVRNTFLVSNNSSGSKTTCFSVRDDGVCTMPQQPMFSGGSGTTSSAATQEVTNMSVIVNNGNHYNTSNGRFTCPIAGIYEVNAHMLSNYAAAYNWIAIFKNGSPFQNMHWNPGSNSGHHYTGLSCLVTCAVNDTLSGGIQNVNNVATAQVANFFLTVKLIG